MTCWKSSGARLIVFLVVLACSLIVSDRAWGQMYLRDISRIKGQEEIQLHGLGLVVGLSGTGGGDRAALQALARSMELMGMPVQGPDAKSQSLLDLKDTKNVALVHVTAIVPQTGARRGDKLNCSVSSYNASSLKGGRLIFAALQGPDLNEPRIAAFCDGRIHLDDPQGAPNTGIVFDGCRMEEDFFNLFHHDGQFTLVLDKHHASFQFANEVALAINEQLMANYRSNDAAKNRSTLGQRLAQARDARSIEVQIPSEYKGSEVDFVATVLETRLSEVQNESRVTINERTGIITIDGDVEIGSVVISHKNLQIKTGDNAPVGAFRPFEIDEDTQRPASPRLDALVRAFNALGVSGQDRIDIIKQLHRNGNLHAKLDIE